MGRGGGGGRQEIGIHGFGGEKKKEKTPSGRSRRSWEQNINRNLKEIRWDVVNWISLAQDRQGGDLVNAVIKVHVL